MTPLPAKEAFEQFYLEARCRLLDLAAILDRLDRGAGSVAADARRVNVAAALVALQSPEPGRAERIQQIFSQTYDPGWSKPAPR